MFVKVKQLHMCKQQQQPYMYIRHKKGTDKNIWSINYTHFYSWFSHTSFYSSSFRSSEITNMYPELKIKYFFSYCTNLLHPISHPLSFNCRHKQTFDFDLLFQFLTMLAVHFLWKNWNYTLFGKNGAHIANLYICICGLSYLFPYFFTVCFAVNCDNSAAN